MKAHFLSEHSLSKFKCDICGETFNTKGDLKVHVAEQHSNVTQKKSLIEKHEELVLRLKKQKLKIFEDLYNLKTKEVKQRRICSCKRSNCRINHSRFRWTACKSDDIFDKLTSSISTDNAGQRCESQDNCIMLNGLQCYPEFHKEVDVLIHRKTNHHTKSSFSCEQCDKVFDKENNLWSHIDNEHKQEFICQQCDNKFVQLVDLNRHIETCHTSLVYECNECDAKFHKENKLKCHIGKIHEPNSEKDQIFECKICNTDFIDENILTSHNEAYHKASVIFQCQQCDEKVENSEELKLHINIHHTSSQHETTFFNPSLISSN